MFKRYLERTLGVYIVILAAVNGVAAGLHWYNLVWWFDMPAHFLGGVCVAYLSALLWRPALRYVRPGRFLFECIITALLFAVLWEALELYLYLHYGSPKFVLLDSISDIGFDLAGIMLGMNYIAPRANNNSNL